MVVVQCQPDVGQVDADLVRAHLFLRIFHGGEEQIQGNADVATDRIIRQLELEITEDMAHQLAHRGRAASGDLRFDLIESNFQHGMEGLRIGVIGAFHLHRGRNLLLGKGLDLQRNDDQFQFLWVHKGLFRGQRLGRLLRKAAFEFLVRFAGQQVTGMQHRHDVDAIGQELQRQFICGKGGLCAIGI